MPDTSAAFPYCHIVFKMKDRSTLAFFDAPGRPPAEKSTRPGYDMFIMQRAEDVVDGRSVQAR
jgi:hypothetical protein